MLEGEEVGIRSMASAATKCQTTEAGGPFLVGRMVATT
jgi:hypothetical protein